MNEIDIRPFIPPCHDLPKYLFYEKYQIDHHWSLHGGLETNGQIVGIALNRQFFLNVLEKHLSYPVHTTPWFFSPFISAYDHAKAVNRGIRTYKPQSIMTISVEKISDYYKSQNDEQLCIYSLRKLVAEFAIPLSKYRNRPFWEHEYLILKRVPVEAIAGVFEPSAFDEGMSTQ